MSVEKIEHYRRADGSFPKYTSVGCYPLLYLTDKWEVLCADCVNEHAQEDDDPDMDIVLADVLWEGPPTCCEQCGEAIESAYGDPDAEQEA